MDHHAHWNDRFATEDYIFGTAPNQFLTEAASFLPVHASILAIADGEGRNGVWLAQQGHRITSIDISEAGQEKAAKLAAERGVTLDIRLADLASHDWPENAYDAVVAIFIQFADPAMRTHIFNGMKRATRANGIIILEGYRPQQLEYGTGGPRIVDNLYTEALLRDAFADWRIEHMVSHDSEINEGAGHRGMSALIDMVGRKPGKSS